MADVNTKNPGAAYHTKGNIAVPPESVYASSVLADQAEAAQVEQAEATVAPPVAPFIDVTPDGPVPVVPEPDEDDEPKDKKSSAKKSPAKKRAPKSKK